MISPGDYLFNQYVLRNWVEFQENNVALISFGKLIKYNIKDGHIAFIDDKSEPINDSVYSKSNNLYSRKLNYLLLSDTPIGAAFLTEREITIKYLGMLVGHVKYAEDFAYRLMVLDDVLLARYNNFVVYYESSEGISNNQSEKWRKLLTNDYEAMNKVILYSHFTDEKFKKSI